MDMEKVNFNKNIKYEKGKKFALRFEGIVSSSNIDKERINKLLDNLINSKSHTNMIRNVAFIRTILKGVEEKLLVVEYSDKNSQEIVKYDNGNLFFFNCKNKNDENKNSITIEFDSGNLKIFVSKKDKDSILDYPHYDSMNHQFNELIKHMHLLKNVKPVNLDMDSKALIEIYKLFYDENPNFSLSNINIRVQTMMSILAQFGITLGADYSFSLLGKSKMPNSLYIEQLVNKLFPLGEITDVDDPIKLADEPKKIIKIVGECVREVINDGYNKDDALITISKVIHAGRYDLSSNSNVKELSNFTNRTQNEVESSIRLVKRIEKKLNSDKIRKIF